MPGMTITVPDAYLQSLYQRAISRFVVHQPTFGRDLVADCIACNDTTASGCVPKIASTRQSVPVRFSEVDCLLPGGLPVLFDPVAKRSSLRFRSKGIKVWSKNGHGRYGHGGRQEFVHCSSLVHIWHEARGCTSCRSLGTYPPGSSSRRSCLSLAHAILVCERASAGRRDGFHCVRLVSLCAPRVALPVVIVTNDV